MKKKWRRDPTSAWTKADKLIIKTFWAAVILEFLYFTWSSLSPNRKIKKNIYGFKVDFKKNIYIYIYL